MSKTKPQLRFNERWTNPLFTTKQSKVGFYLATLLLFVLSFTRINAQSLANYTFATSTSGSLQDMTGATTLITGNNDDTGVPVFAIGFDFYFMGTKYTHISANSNGQARLHTSSGATAIGGSAVTAFSAGNATFALMAGDNELNNGMTSLVVGTAPNRKFVIEWNQFYAFYNDITNSGNMQMILNESTGVVEYIYGNIINSSSANVSRSIFISSSNTATTAGYVTVSATPSFTLATAPVTNSFAPLVSIANLAGTTNGSLRTFSWTPNSTSIPAAPTSLTFSAITSSTITPNWIDNSTDETFFIVTRATDAAFTQNVSVVNVPSTSTAGTGTAYNLPQTGLSPGTLFYYNIQASSEAVIPGTGVTGSESTLAATTYFWVGAASSTWNTPANWNTLADGTGLTRTTPNTTDVLIVDGALTTPGGAVTINTIDANYTVGRFVVTSNTTLTLQSSSTATRTITVSGGVGNDFIVDAGSTLLLTSATQPVAFAFSGASNTGLIDGTVSFSGNAGNTITTTGGTNTLVTVSATGIINLGFAGNSLVGSVATLSFLAGSTCNSTGATTGAPPVPLATWAATSNLTISGITSSTTTATNNNQSFGNFTYNCPNATGTMSFWGATTTAVVKGNLTIQAINTGKFRATTGGTVTINGDLIVNNGTFEVSSTTGSVNVAGNVTLNGGTIDVAFNGAANLRTAGNFIQTGGTLTQTNANGNLEFNGTSAQSFTPATNTGSIGVRVNNTTGVTLNGNINLNRLTISNGNLSGSGIITYNSTTSSLVYNSTAANQTITNTEYPSTNSPVSLTINNTFASGVVTMPFSRTLAGTTGVLALTAGILDNTGNTITVTNTAANSVTGGSATSFLKGAIERTLPLNLATGSTYLFPVGKSGYNPMSLINPLTTGVVVIKSEVVDAATGGTPSALFASLNTNRYWATSFTSGETNFASDATTAIRLNDAPGTADGIAGSSTLTGTYSLVGGVLTTATPTSLTTSSPTSTIPAFMVMGTKSAATLTGLAISPTGNVCVNIPRNISVVVIPGGAAITSVVLNYSVNGTAQTPVTMSNSTNIGGLSADTWTGIIPTVTPINGNVTWSVSATDNNTLVQSINGTPYLDSTNLGPAVVITSSLNNFCGTGGTAVLTASSTDASMAYSWSALNPATGSLESTSGTAVNATVSATSDFKLSGTNANGCVSIAYYSLGVYPLPAATVTTTASGVCPGTSATIGSGLSAGNFSSVSINHSPLTAPANAIKLVDAGTALVTRNLGTGLDDGGWSGVPVGFNFNFFGTNYSTISVGTNGTVFFGTTPDVTDYEFLTLPSTTEPFNMVAVLAMDNNLTGATGGTIKYWTTGYAPNRKFVLSYENVKEYGDTKFSTAQAIFYETIGVIEVHVASSTNQDQNKLVGVNNGDGTIGVLAYASGTASSVTNPTASPFAYRFTPPANYSTTWAATNLNGTTTIASGTNIFSQSVTPAITTDYAISYTNQTTGCTNAPGSAQVNMLIYSDVAPTGVNTIASSTSFCDGQSVNFNLDYTGTTNGIVYQWQVSTVSGVWNDVATATNDVYSLIPTQNASYRCKITACNGTPSFSSEVAVNYSNEITSTTPATRCGVGTATISAVGSAGSTIAWYATATATTPLGTGSPFTTPTISQTTTYFVAAETFAGTCSSARVPVTVTVTDAPVVTLTNNQAPFCGTGGTATITATTTANYGFTWSLSNPNATISNQTATSIDVTVSQSTSVNLTALEVGTGCVSISTISISVYPLPTANVTSDVNGVCPGTAANISTGLSAGNFTSTSIPHAPLTAPVNAVTLATGGAELVPTDLGFGLDDGGWSGIPVGFNFNFFGTSYNTISIGTNGTVFFGATPNVGDFTFTTLPSTTEPFNMVAVLAMDNDLGVATGGTIKYWTEGTIPNRKFIVSYENVQEYNALETSTAQAIFYETVGEIDVHVTSSTNVDRNKLVGVNNGDGTIGVLAFASGTVASPTNPITNPFAYRFAPPANYTTVWTSTNTQGTTTIASGTNIFTQAVIPTETTVYSISYTNQTTGCTNAPGSADVTITILGNVAPVGVSTVSSVTNVCEGVNFQISANYTGSSQGLTYQWQFSIDNGQNFIDIAGENGLTLTTSQNDTTIYRLSIVSCGGTPSYSSLLTINMSAPTDCYCVPTYTFGTSDGDLISNVEIVGTTLANNTGFVAGGPSYTFFNGQPNYTATLLPSSSYTLNISTGEYGSQGYAAWIDYNDDGIFDATELIGATNGTIGTGNTPGQVNASSSFVIALACTPPVGVHRMRIRGAFFQNGQSIQPCTNYGFGETEDYLITIAPAPTCPSPGLLVGGTTTTTSADVNWSLGCSTASAFDFEYGPVGFTQGTGTLVSNVSATTSTTLSGLIPNSSYQVYYRANCGNGDVSAWSVPVTVSTQCAPISLVNPGAQVVCNTYALPTLAELTPSNNAGLVLSYRTATNGGGTVLTSNITTTQTVHIYGVAGACSANASFLVTVNNSSTSTTNVTQCSSYTWTNNVTYTASGTHTQTLVNAAGCDSVATLNLTITQPTTSTLNEVACQTFTLNNQTYTASGTYVQTLTNVAGCDSTLTLNLTIGQPDAVSVTEVACDSYSWNGTTYTTSGVYVDTLTNAFGCDSVVTLNLTINNTSSSNTVVSECASYQWNGTTYTTSGSYTFTAQNAAGCDSTATLVLTIGNNSSITTAATCGSFTWTNGTTYTASGTYTQTLTNAAGCDSLVTLNLTINPTPTATATDNGNGTGTLVASTGASYQWIDCATNTPITGATSATYTAPINGSYAVIVTNSTNCSATSSCVIVDYIGLEENTLSFNVYPNPTTGAINIVIDQTTAKYDVTVEDMNGRAVANFGSLINGNGVYSLDLSNVVTGVYFIKLRNELEERTVRIIKQ